MKAKATPRAVALLILLVLVVSLAYGYEKPRTTNPVQSIEPAAFDKMIAAKSYRGLIVAMASWCPPCREELPVFADLYRKYRDQGIGITAISLDADGPSAVQPLIDKLKIPFPVYWIGTKAITRYKIVGVPTLLVVDNGKVIQKIPGSRSRKFIEKKIKSLLSPPA